MTADEQFDEAIRELGELRRFAKRNGIDGNLVHGNLLVFCDKRRDEWDRLVVALEPSEIDVHEYGPGEDMIAARRHFGPWFVSVSKIVTREDPLPFSSTEVVDRAADHVHDFGTTVGTL